MEVWLEIAKLEGQTLKTLDRGNSFDIVSVDARAVIVRPCVRKIERKIQTSIFEDAFTELTQQGQLSRIDIRDKYSDFNPAYVAAILAELPNVSVLRKPIRLYYKANMKL